MKLFKCIVNDGKGLFKTMVAAKNKKQLLNEGGGNGTFEKITEVTGNYPINSDKLDTDLLRCGWGEGERKIICALVEEHMKHNHIAE